MDALLKGKVALVTGGGSGLGRATAMGLAKEGARVAVSDIEVDAGEETTRLIEQTGAESVFIPCDISRTIEVQQMVEKTVDTFGRLDCAFNNAGIEGMLVPIVDYPEEMWLKVININLTGVWLCMKHEIAQMVKQGGGAIVNTSSAAGLVGVPGSTAYTAAKHGVVGLTKTVALEYAKTGIRVNAVCPGAFYTPMLDRLVQEYPDMEKWYHESHPLGRLGQPDELAQAVVWLCSDAASFVTGIAMPVDAGLTAQ